MGRELDEVLAVLGLPAVKRLRAPPCHLGCVVKAVQVLVRVGSVHVAEALDDSESLRLRHWRRPSALAAGFVLAVSGPRAMF